MQDRMPTDMVEQPSDEGLRKSRHYSVDAIRASFVHFVLGKAVGAAAAFATLILLIRYLAPTEFGVYTSWHALVLMVGLLSSLGVNPLLLRFIPDLRAANNNQAMYLLLAAGIAARAILFAAAALLVMTFSEPLARLLKFEDFAQIFPLYLLVGFFRVNSTFTVGVLESLLWQREAQYSVAIATLVRLGGVLYALQTNSLDLQSYVWIELVSELLNWGLLLGAAFWRWRRDPQRHRGHAGELQDNLGRYINFGFWTYAQNLTSVLNGSAPNRLLIGFFLPLETIAVFGVIDRLIRFLRRYEPLRMLIGLVRPVFNARFAKADDFTSLASFADCLFRVNLLVLVVPMIAVAIAGDVAFAVISDGKYTDIAALFIGFYLVVIIASANTVLDILVKLVELTRIYTVSNLILSVSVLLAIPLIPFIGLWSLVVANAVGYLLSFALIVSFLHRQGFRTSVSWHLMLRLIAACLAAICIGELSSRFIPLLAAIGVGYAIFAIGLWLRPPFTEAERTQLVRFARRKRRA